MRYEQERDPTAIQRLLVVELSTYAGRVMTYEHLPRRGWGWGSDDAVRLMRTKSAIRRKLGDDSDNPTYIFTELRVGYGMPKTDTPKPEME